MYFTVTIEPDLLKNTGSPVVTLTGQLPQDDMTRYSMAQIAREGPTPLLSDRAIRDRILAIQDADQMDDSIKEQMAEKMLPEAALWTLLRAAERQGRDDLVQFYVGELSTVLKQKQQATQMMDQQMMMQQMMQEQQMLAPQGPQGPQGPLPPQEEAGGPPTTDPRVMPNAMMGVPPPAPTPQAGPNVPPGTPRPGAQGGM